MKVYELMNELAKVESGAEVRFSIVINIAELIECDEIDNGDYCYSKTVEEIDAWDETEVFLG